MYLRNIVISNYHTFTYHPQLTLTKGMEFDTDPYTSNVNILVGPNGSGKSNFLDLITLLCNRHHTGHIAHHQIKKHPGFESYPTIVVAQWTVGTHDLHDIIIEYHLDTREYYITQNSAQINIGNMERRKPILLQTPRSVNEEKRLEKTTTIIHQHLGLLYNSHNLSYLTSYGAIRKRDDLGSGEKAILSIVNTILNNQYSGGIILIDEPETHLHPQYQRQLGIIIEHISQYYNVQILIATHSPFFINEKNIENVFRFTLRNGHSYITNPLTFSGQDQAKLKQILTDGNMAKLFFTDTIIMVEGDTDEYFLNRYIKHYFSQHHIDTRKYHYEIVNIAGKSSLHARRTFCQQFEIKRSFIGDWDNVISSSSFGSDIEAIKTNIPHHQQGHKITKSQHYRNLIKEISDHHETLEQHINQWINEQEKRHIYILRHGDLEAYLGLTDKGLDVTIERCTHQMQYRVNDRLYQHYRENLDNIIQMIFGIKHLTNQKNVKSD